ncbi:maleylpyruvate isomerase family mycothiol-dependent enzyme [Auraticoccus sp. F435]|uniref:Maleylpyruvate isomerase family mycothiol-dependent enzyme n=1 Tax=Auraticoccus cholistanensis TaxID=2656650 RepID=A0A6A9V1A0_9ACTN|nr:maleylpyruvate isomerase family mycothiol-dependent enzyme [Auraticoccus cholistanensis]MVA76740.1 maleylpyruvate isomerase family mycothiol-dependent enzyme [Auraticoccus cholistanensis]
MDAQLLDSAVDQTREVARWVEGADPGAPVPTCPEWTLADLVGHIGSTQRWVDRLVVEKVADPAAAFSLGWEEAPADASQWPAWLVEGADRTRASFAAATGGADVFDPSGGGDGLAFWSRRLFGEAAVHRIDAAATLGLDYHLDPDLAVAAIEDWLGTIASSGWAQHVPGFTEAVRGDGQTLAWVAVDTGTAWLLRRTDAPLVLTSGRHLAREAETATVTISGPACELLQVVSRRLPVDAARSCTVVGDRAELDHLVDHMDWVGA